MIVKKYCSIVRHEVSVKVSGGVIIDCEGRTIEGNTCRLVMVKPMLKPKCLIGKRMAH
jgi:hypothetical protein